LANMDDDGNGNLSLDEFLNGCLPSSGSSKIWKGAAARTIQAKPSPSPPRPIVVSRRRGSIQEFSGFDEPVFEPAVPSGIDQHKLVQNMKQLFMAADVSDGTLTFSNATPDNYLDRTELAHRLDGKQLMVLLKQAGVLGKLKGEHNVKQIVRRMDTNNDGKVSLGEFINFAVPARAPADNTSWGFGASTKAPPAVHPAVHRTAGAEARHEQAPPGRIGAWTTWNPKASGNAQAAAVPGPSTRRLSGAAKVAGTDKDSREIEVKLKKTYERAEKSKGKTSGSYVDPVRSFTASQMDFRVGYMDVQNAIGKLKSFNPGARTAFPFATTIADLWREHSSSCGRDGKMTIRDWLTNVDPLATVTAAIEGSFDV